jgi:hypothetical protein
MRVELGLLILIAPLIEKAQLSISKSNAGDGLPKLVDTGDVTVETFFIVTDPE